LIRQPLFRERAGDGNETPGMEPTGMELGTGMDTLGTGTETPGPGPGTGTETDGAGDGGGDGGGNKRRGRNG
jgi:hypothetical protein